MEVPAGQVNFRGSLPRSAYNVYQPMLHPVQVQSQQSIETQQVYHGQIYLHMTVVPKKWEECHERVR